MKKYCLLFVLFLAAFFPSHAQVAYLLTESAITDLPAENEGGVDQKPEQNAANWFQTTYVNTNKGKFVSLAELKAGLSGDVQVLWINIDRTGLVDLAGAGIDADAVAAVKTFVENGGNLLLTKQAVHLAHAIGRIGYSPIWSNVGYSDGGDTWYIKTKLGLGTSNPTDRSNHPIYRNIDKDENGKFPLVGAVKRSDRNNYWSDYMRKEPLAPGQETHYDNGNVQRLLDFEADWGCQALATWPHIEDYCIPMVINFLPDWGSFKGGILTIGLAAYQWGTSNNGQIEIDNVKKLTQNSLDYLTPIAASWNSAPADGVIGATMTASVTTAGTVSAWSSSNNDVASVTADGVISYNGFGSCTISATVTSETNVPTVLTSDVVNVTGGAPAQYAYILPYSLYTMSHYDNEEGFYPDYQTAEWFYRAYVSQGKGFFMSPVADIPATVSVIWMHNDHVGLSSEQFYSDFGGNSFKSKLEAFVEAGGNVFLSKQATRFVSDIGRCAAQPVFRINGWQDYDVNARYMTADFYALKDEGGNRVGHDNFTHEVYKYMPDDAWVQHDENGSLVRCKWLIWDANEGTNRRTDNNFNWESWDGYEGPVSLARATKFETDYSCTILGGYGHTTALDGAAFVEFKPKDEYKGTVIALGLHSYQWGANNTKINNIYNLTKGILEYLSPEELYERDVRSGYFGTICLPKASTRFEGADMYEIAELTADGRGIELDPVTSMQAGKPYIFLATAATLRVYMTGAENSAVENNGLVGNLGASNMDVPLDAWILKDNQLYIVDSDNVKIAQNRAYINPADIPASGTSSPRNGRRSIGIHNTPTACETVSVDSHNPTKVLNNGVLYIIRDGKTYNAQGQCIR